MGKVCCLIALGTQGAQGIKVDTGIVSTGNWQDNGQRKTSLVLVGMNGVPDAESPQDTQLQMPDRLLRV